MCQELRRDSDFTLQALMVCHIFVMLEETGDLRSEIKDCFLLTTTAVGRVSAFPRQFLKPLSPGIDAESQVTPAHTMG